MENIKNKLISGDIIEISNNQDVCNIWFSDITKDFVLEFNAKVFICCKTFNNFLYSVNKFLKKHNLNTI